jgi:hypothetical protein
VSADAAAFALAAIGALGIVFPVADFGISRSADRDPPNPVKNKFAVAEQSNLNWTQPECQRDFGTQPLAEVRNFRIPNWSTASRRYVHRIFNSRCSEWRKLSAEASLF